MAHRGKRRYRNWLIGGLVIAVFGACATAVHRRLDRVLLIPEAPSRGMSVEGKSPAPPRAAVRVLYVGHSLVNTQMPAMAASIAASLGVDFAWDAQLIDGGSLEVGWNQGHRAQGVRAREALTTGEYDTLVLTEAVNLDDHLRWSEPAAHARRWYELAREHRPDIRLFFYETWHHRGETRWLVGYPMLRSWPEVLSADLRKWEHIVDEASGGDPTLAADIVPGGQAMAGLVDAIEAGQVPGLDDPDELFLDGVHPTPLGNYYVALVHVATLARKSPVGATAEVDDGTGARVGFDPATAAKLQELAWHAVVAYPRSGVLE